MAKYALRWMVYYHDINAQKLTTLNIFNHGGFADSIQKNFKKNKNREDFAKQLKSDLMYYFWSKSEYEVIIAPWSGDRHTQNIKIDIYDQVMNNFDIFVDYVWNSRQHRITKPKAS